MPINRWTILGVLFVARFAVGFQFQSAGSVTPFIVDEFNIDFAGFGTLVGLYMIPGLIIAIPSGFIGQRFGEKSVVLFGLFLMVLGGVIAGVADNYIMLAIGRIVSGAGAAFLFVLMTKMLTDWFVGKDLFFGMAIFIIGWPIGIAAGQTIQASIAGESSWNIVFHLTALGSLIAFLAIAWAYQTPPNLTTNTVKTRVSLNQRELILVTIAGLVWMCINGAYLVLVSFAPIFLNENGTPFATGAGVVSLMSWVFLFSLPLGGLLATRLGAPNIVMFSGLSGTIVVGGLILYTDMPFVTFALFGIFYAICVPIIAAMPAEVLRPETRGPGLGIYYIWYFAGSAFMPILGGYFKDITGTAASSVLFGVSMMMATLLLAALFRMAQIYFPVRIETSEKS